VTGLGRTKLYELIGAGRIVTTTIGRRRLVVVRSHVELMDVRRRGATHFLLARQGMGRIDRADTVRKLKRGYRWRPVVSNSIVCTGYVWSDIFSRRDSWKSDMSVRPPVIKRLFAQSGNRCAFPTCTTPIVESETVLGEICHIAAANAQGPRYDATQTDEERNGFGNLILLCPTHHRVVDADLEAYTVARLLKMKADHERAATAVPDQQASDGALLVLDSSVRSHNQSGGLTAQTVNAGTINFAGGSAAADWTAKAFERYGESSLTLSPHSATSHLSIPSSRLMS
jgi:hypothetical protein